MIISTGENLFYVEHTSSTNDEITHFYHKPFSAVYTLNQKNGRGQYGKQWISPSGKAAAYTLAIGIPHTLSHLSPVLFNFRTANLLWQYFHELLPNENIFIKWPNDLIINEKKCAGILLERQVIHGEKVEIIGIGINVLQSFFPELHQAGSLYTQTGKQFCPHELVKKFHHFLVQGLQENVGIQDIMTDYNAHLFRKDILSTFLRKNDGHIFQGRIEKVNSNGLLMIKTPQGIIESFQINEIQMMY